MSTIKVQEREINHFGKEIEVDFPVYLRRDEQTVSKVVPEYYDHNREKIKYLVEVKVHKGRMDHHPRSIEIKRHGYDKNEGVFEEFDFIRRISNLEEYGTYKEEFDHSLKKVRNEISEFSNDEG